MSLQPSASDESYEVPTTEAGQPVSSAPPDQVGAVPCRLHDGRLEILLVTSRTHGRWIVPKGNIEQGATRIETAAVEAFEECGVRGTVRPEPLGRYRHGRGRRAPLVEVYLLHVEADAERWPERHERDREWVTASSAADRVDVAGLRPILGYAAMALAGLESKPPPPPTA